MNRKNCTIPKAALSAITTFAKEEDGQDVVEYSLLLGFIALSSTAILAGIGTTVHGVWTTVNSTLKNAAS